jgi:MFS family permease
VSSRPPGATFGGLHPRWRLDIGAVFVYLALGGTFVALPRTVVNDLGGSTAIAGFSVSVFFVAAVVARPLAGRLVDARGRRTVLVAAPLVVAAVMLGLAVADNVATVLVLRFVQGVAGGSFYVAAVTAETDMAPPDRRASAVARLSVAVYVAYAVGPVVGEVLLDRGQQVTFTALAGLAAIGLVFAVSVPETRPNHANQLASQRPPPGPLIHRSAVLPGLTLLTMGVGYASVTALSGLYAPTVGLSSSAVLYATFAVTIGVLRLGAGRLADSVGLVRVMFPGMTAFSLGFAVMSVAAALSAGWVAVVGVALVGIGWAVVFPAVMAWLADQVPDTQRGAALGTAVAFMDMGQGAGGYVVGGVAGVAGYAWGYAVPALLALGGTVVLALAVRSPSRTATNATNAGMAGLLDRTPVERRIMTRALRKGPFTRSDLTQDSDSLAHFSDVEIDGALALLIRDGALRLDNDTFQVVHQTKRRSGVSDILDRLGGL